MAAATRTLDLLFAALRGFALGVQEQIHAVRALRRALHGFVTLKAAGAFAMAVDRDASFDALFVILRAGFAARSGTP